MDLTVSDLKQGATLTLAGANTTFVADRSYATIPGINLHVTNHLLIGIVAGLIILKLVE